MPCPHPRASMWPLASAMAFLTVALSDGKNAGVGGRREGAGWPRPTVVGGARPQGGGRDWDARWDSPQSLLLILQRPGFLVGAPPAVPADPSPWPHACPRLPRSQGHLTSLVRAIGQMRGQIPMPPPATTSQELAPLRRGPRSWLL